MNTIKEPLSVECHIFATTSIWRLSDIRRFPMRSILNQIYSCKQKSAPSHTVHMPKYLQISWYVSLERVPNISKKSSIKSKLLGVPIPIDNTEHRATYVATLTMSSINNSATYFQAMSTRCLRRAMRCCLDVSSSSSSDVTASSGGATSGRTTSNDFAEKLPPWLSTTKRVMHVY